MPITFENTLIPAHRNGIAISGVCLMVICVLGLQYILPSIFIDRWTSLVVTVLIGAVSYLLGMLIFAPGWCCAMVRNAALFVRTR